MNEILTKKAVNQNREMIIDKIWEVVKDKDPIFTQKELSLLSIERLLDICKYFEI